MTVKAERRMTENEVAVLKEIVRWRRAQGIDFDFRGATYRLIDGRRIAWNTWSAVHWPRTGEVGVNPNQRRPMVWHEVESVTQAVDVLVALGYLPVRFSSAYRKGWDEANQFTADVRATGLWAWAQYEAACPAVPPTW